jgi:hypothetical protein
MNNNQITCDPDRIELSLQQRLNDREQNAFELHLDECGDCRERLEKSAAADGNSISIPQEAYADLEQPLLNSIELRTEAGYDENPWLYIVLKVGYKTSDGKWNPKRVHIAYHAGRVEARSIQTPKSNGTYSRQQENYGKR